MVTANIVHAWRSVGLFKIWLLPLALLVAISSETNASELWEFIQVGKANQSNPAWSIHTGKAEIENDGRQITIFAYYEDDAKDNAKPRDVARIVIRATIDSDHSIKGTGTLLNTDASPWRLSGRLISRTEHETWGSVRKLVTYKEIVFGHPPNVEFLGFLGREVRDE